MSITFNFTKVRDVKSPVRGTSYSAGIDFFIPNDFPETHLKPGESVLIPSGIKVEIPNGYMMKFDNKSGVASKRGLIVLANVIDQDYAGEVHINLCKVASDVPDNSPLKPGDKIVQGILIPVSYAMPHEIDNATYEEIMKNSERGSGGFGSTGTN